MGGAAIVANFLKKTYNRTILFLLSALITLPLQVVVPFMASAAETGTWVDGDMPQLTLDSQLSTSQAFLPNCTPQDWKYHSYTKPDGQYDPVGRQVPVNVCATQAGFGEISTSGGETYIRPNTAIAFPVPYSIAPNPSTRGFAYTPPTSSPGFSNIALFSSLGSAGKFTEDTYSKRLAYTLNPLTEDKFLHTSSGARIVVRGGISYSSNGAWLVTYSTNAGYIRVNTVTGEVLRFDTTNLSFNLGVVPDIKLAISDDGNAVVLSGRGEWAQPARVYDLAGCTAPIYPIQGSATSVWGCKNRYLYTSFNQAHPGLRGMFDMRFSADGKSVRGTVETYTNNTSQYYRGTMHVAGYEFPPPVTYLALGDSFSSGEGAYDYVYGTDIQKTGEVPGQRGNLCHLSQRSYAHIAMQSLGIDSGDFHSVACSGAMSQDYYRNPQYDNIPDDFVWHPGEDSQREFLRNADPDVVTISMFGNDIGFGDKIERCLTGLDPCFHYEEERRAVAQEIYQLYPTMVHLYESLQRESGDAKIYVMGYPQLMSATGDCGLNTPFDLEERAMARGLVRYLNAVIKASTQRSGVVYIDVENVFAGHQLCEPGKKAVNGLTHGNDTFIRHLGPIGNESFHPNALGHRLMAQALLAQSDQFTRPMVQFGGSQTVDGSVEIPYTSSSVYHAFIGDAPSRGFFKNAQTAVISKAQTVYRGGTIVIGAVKDGLKPSSWAEVWLHSDPIHIGTLTTNEHGELLGTITIPDGVAPGFHTIEVRTADLSNQEISLEQTVYVAADPDDFDGDGILNEDEACLVVEPAGVDEDQDGIDDACDPEITEPPLPADSTPPEVVGTPDREPNAEGWYNGSVTINWTAVDSEPSSGAPTQPTPTIADQEGAHTYTSESSCDPVGNCSTGSLELKIDKTMPNITHSLSTQPNIDGWHNTDVTVLSFCDDTLSGVLACSPSITLSIEGVNQVVEGVVQDIGGNIATTSTSINIDKTAPSLSTPVWTNSPKSILGTASVAVPAVDNLSGVTEAEYYLGDTDPGQGNGATMQVNDGEISVDFNADFPTGVYKVTMRAKDKAGNWSTPVTDYLVVYDPFGTRMTGKRALIPSLANGDILPGLANVDQTDKAKFGFNVRYDKYGEIHKNSDFQFKYDTGTNCNKPAQAQNCHTFELKATSISWLTTQGENNSTGIFQGTASLEVDDTQSNVVFLLTGLDGELLDATSEDRLTLQVYPEGANPYIHNPIYQVDAKVLRGNIKIRTW